MAVLRGRPSWRSTTASQNSVGNLCVGLQDHSGVVLGSGTSASKKSLPTADTSGIYFNFDASATSGTTRALNLRLSLTGVGIAGEAARIYATTAVACGSGGIHGAHITLSVGAGGSTAGLAVGCRSQLEYTCTPAGSGTYAGAQSEIYFGTSATVAGAAVVAMHRFIIDGNATAMALFDTSGLFFDIRGLTSASTKCLYNNTVYSTLKCRINGTIKYLLFAAAEAAS